MCNRTLTSFIWASIRGFELTARDVLNLATNVAEPLVVSCRLDFYLLVLLPHSQRILPLGKEAVQRALGVSGARLEFGRNQLW